MKTVTQSIENAQDKH